MTEAREENMAQIKKPQSRASVHAIVKRSPRNIFREIAKNNDRDYITPEDIAYAIKRHRLSSVRRDLLAVIGKQVDLGIEDCGLCAFVAWRGKRSV